MLEHLRSLAVFARTAELGSFRAAARALGLSPSVVSHHVSELERRLALPLLYRTTRRLALTPDGEKLFEAAREMLSAAERGLDAVSGRSESPSGTLRLTAPAFLAETSLSRDLAAFSAAHPGVRLVVSFTDARRDLLRDGLDLAFRVGDIEDSTHRTRKLADMRRVLVGSPRYVGARKPPQALRDLAGWDFVQLSSRPPEIRLTPPGKKTELSLAVTPRISVDNAAAIRELVMAGAGLSTLPEVLARSDLAAGRLVEVLPGWRAAAVGVHAVWPHNAQRAGLTSRFVDFMTPRAAALFAPPAGKAPSPGRKG
jgi:DNA-binding transcriptional LysR family regulator